jgi:mediator of RNA polymerase II transcription subunit 24
MERRVTSPDVFSVEDEAIIDIYAVSYNIFLQDLDGLCPSSKLLRLSTGVTEAGDTAALFGTTTSSSQNTNQPYSSSSQPLTIKEPLQKALNDLFHTFTVIAGRDGEVSQQTHFVCKFLQFVVCCGRDRTRLVLQGMPNTLVCEINEHFSEE